MTPRSDTRQKMIDSAAELFRERGVYGTSFADVLERSGAPRGSVYHHFKGGKAQLAEDALISAGAHVTAGATAMLEEHDAVTAVGLFCGQWADLLRDTDFAAGCSIVAGAVDGDHEPNARVVAGGVFAEWVEAIARGLQQHGISAARADSLATLLIASVEGAVVLSRAQRTLAPLERVTNEVQAVVAAALEGTTTN